MRINEPTYAVMRTVMRESGNLPPTVTRPTPCWRHWKPSGRAATDVIGPAWEGDERV